MAEGTPYPTADHIGAGAEPAETEEEPTPAEESTEEGTESTEGVPGA